MLGDDLGDLVMSVVFLVILILAGSFALESGFIGTTDIALDKIEINDDKELLLLNYIKTETDNGRIYDLIVASEGDDETFETLEDETDNIMDIAIVRDYDIRIIYPENEKRISSGSLEDFSEIKLPSENGLISVKMDVVFKEVRS